MFGYVRVNSAELKVKEYEFYRGTYCGLCRAMGKCTGQCSRMTLNYDFVFLALVRLAITSDSGSVSFVQKRCLAHPFKKRNSMVENRELDYCASASAILNYHKIVDDIADERGIRRLIARVVLPFSANARKKAIKRSPLLEELDRDVAELLARLTELEKAQVASVDRPADIFGTLLGKITSFGLDGADHRIAFELGRNIGAWVYIADAIDDMKEDTEKKRYNPLLKLYNGRLPSNEELEYVASAVKNHLYGAEAAFDLITVDNGAVKNIIQNILYLGITERMDEIINLYTKAKEEAGRKKKK